MSFLWGVTLVLVANTGYAGWSGGAADQEDNERSNVIMRPGDYPPGYSKHEIFHHSKTSTRHTFWETKTFTHTERGSGRSKQVDYKRIELMFWANFPCGFKKFSTMAQHGCRAADQVADNFQKGNLPQRPPNPLGDVSAVKTYQLTSCGSQKGITSRSLEFGFALGELLVRGRISGSTGSYGCDIYLPCPTYAELFQRLEVLAGIMRRYAKSAGMYKEEAGQSLAGQQHQSTPDTQVKEDQPSDQITPRGSKEAGGILPPWVPAAAGAAAGGVAAVGSLLTMLASGVRPREVWDGVKELLTQGPATEPEVVEEYSPEPDYQESAPESEVVEEYPPEEEFGEPKPEPEGFRSKEHHRDGESNEYGEVWSDEYGGWTNPRALELDRQHQRTWDEAREINRGHQHSLAEADEAVRQARQERNEAVQRLVETERRSFQEDLQEGLDFVLDQNRERGLDSDIRREFLEKLQGKLNEVEGLEDDFAAFNQMDQLAKIMGHQMRRDFKLPDYTMSDAVLDTGLQWSAMAADIAFTKGGASAAVEAYRAARDVRRLGGSWQEAAKYGAEAGAWDLAFNVAMGKAMKVGGKIPKVQSLIKTMGEIDIFPGAAGKTGREEMKRLYGVGMEAIKEDYEHRAIKKLGPGHPAHAIGEINEIMAKEGAGLKPGLVSATNRLDPNTKTYIKGLETLEKGPGKTQGLSKQAKEAVDAVRHDLDLRSREGALKLMYKAHPELKGTIIGFDNTGSHAKKGINYRILESDIDFTPVHNGTVEGRMAAAKFSKYYDDALRKASGERVGIEQMNAHCYGNNHGPGAYSSKGGLKLKDMMDQTSGRRDVVSGTKITHSVRGDDLVEVGPRTRWTTGSAKKDAVQLHDMRRDAFNKYQQELPDMPDAKERVIQAAKAYKTCRILEAKSVGGRTLSEEAELFAKAKEIKELSGRMSGSEQETLTNQFLDALKSDAGRDLERAL